MLHADDEPGGLGKQATGVCINLRTAQQQDLEDVPSNNSRKDSVLNEFATMAVSLSQFLLVLLSSLAQDNDPRHENGRQMRSKPHKGAAAKMVKVIGCLGTVVPCLASAIEYVEQIEALHVNTSEIRRTLYHSLLLVLQINSRLSDEDPASKTLQDIVNVEAARLVPILWQSLDRSIRFETSKPGKGAEPDDGAVSGLLMLIQVLLRRIGETHSAQVDLSVSRMDMNASMFARAPNPCRHGAPNPFGEYPLGESSEARSMHPLVAETIAKNGLLEVLMERVSACLQSQCEGQFVKSAMNLFLALASNCIGGGAQALTMSRASVGSRGLVQHLLIGTLPSGMPTMDIEDGNGLVATWPVQPYYQPKGSHTCSRNEWHLIWCSSIQVLTAALNSLQHSEHAYQECVDFVTSRYQDIAAKLDSLRHAPKLCIGELEEASALMSLFAELSKFSDLPRRMPFILNSGGLLEVITRLFRRCVDFFPANDVGCRPEERHERLASRLEEMTEARTREEKLLKDDPSPQKNFNRFSNQLATDAVNLVHQILRLCLVTIANISIPSCEDDEGLFSSSRKQLHSNIKASFCVFANGLQPGHRSHEPSLKTLVDCFKMGHQVSRDTIKKESKQPQYSFYDGWPTNEELEFLRERALVVYMSQLTLEVEQTQGDSSASQTLLKSIVHRHGDFMRSLPPGAPSPCNERRSASTSPRPSFLGGPPKSPDLSRLAQSARRDSRPANRRTSRRSTMLRPSHLSSASNSSYSGNDANADLKDLDPSVRKLLDKFQDFCSELFFSD